MKNILRCFFLVFILFITMNSLNAQWRSIGPFGAAYGTRLQLDPHTSGRIFALSEGSLYRSDNNGDLWKNVSPPIGPKRGEYGLVLAESAPNEIYALSSNTIYRSYDNGDNWTLYYSDLTRTLVFLDRFNPAHLVSTGSGGWHGGTYVQTIQQSTDKGGHWQSTADGIDTTGGPLTVWVNPGFPSSMFVTQLITYGGDVIDGVASFRTTDGGAHWEAIQLPTLPTQTNYEDMAFDPLNANTVYYQAGSTWIKSTDNGLSWADMGQGLLSSTPGHLFVSSTNPQALYIPFFIESSEECVVYKSETGGSSWARWASIDSSRACGSVCVDGQSPYYSYIASYPRGVYRSTDAGVTWSGVFQDFTYSSVNSYAVAGEKTIYAGVSDAGLEKTTDGGMTWQILVKDASSQAGDVMVSRTNPQIVYTNAYINGGGLSISTDAGISWQTHSCGRLSFVKFAVGADDSTIFGNIGQAGNDGMIVGGIVKSTDGGQHWDSLDFRISEINWVYQISVDPSNRDIVYALLWIRGTSYRNILVRSTDGGGHWTELADKLDRFCLNPRKPNHIYYISDYASNQVAYVSSNGGTSFQAVSGGYQVVSVAADPKWENIAYALMLDGSVASSADTGMTWNIFSTTTRYSYLSTINAVSTSDGGTSLFIETTTNGILCYKIEDPVSVKATAEAKVLHYTLFQNYPNPFNPSTVIRYDLPVNTWVTLKIFDVLGRELTTLVNECQIAGSHSATFQANFLPSGVYFYRLQAGLYTETKKLVLMR